MMRKIILCMGLLLVAGNAFAQDRLEPAPSVFDTHRVESIEEYQITARKLLFAGYPPRSRSMMSYFVQPSFSNEYMLELIKTDSTYSLRYRETDTNVWYSDNRSRIKVTERLHPISGDCAGLLIELFRTAVLASRFEKDKDEWVGEYKVMTEHNDGETHYFSVFETKSITGYVWSPEQGSNTRELVDLCEAIARQAKVAKDGAEIGFSEEMIARIESVKAKFPEVTPLRAYI